MRGPLSILFGLRRELARMDSGEKLWCENYRPKSIKNRSKIDKQLIKKSTKNRPKINQHRPNIYQKSTKIPPGPMGYPTWADGVPLFWAPAADGVSQFWSPRTNEVSQCWVARVNAVHRFWLSLKGLGYAQSRLPRRPVQASKTPTKENKKANC